MGLRDRLRRIKLFLTDPDAYSEAHSARMNEAFAERLKEENEQPRPGDAPEPTDKKG